MKNGAIRGFTTASSVALLAALGLLLPSSPPARAAAEKELRLETKIAAATVYVDRAQVTRSGSVDLAAGPYRLLCDDLPRAFDESSLQVEGAGTARTRILGIDVMKVRGLAADSPRYKDLKDRLDKLTATRDTLQIELGSLTSSAQFLDNFARFPFEKGSAKLATEIFRVQDWKNVIDFLAAERVKTNEGTDGLNKRIAKLAEEIDWITGQLDEMRTKDDWGKRVVVDVEALGAGSLDLSLVYNVPGASWSPEYTIRFDEGAESIALAYNARVRQSTGEDWNNVSLTLSTARPQLGAAPPEIAPLYLQQTPQPRPLARLDQAVAGKELHARGGRAAETSIAAEAFESEMPQAGVLSSEFAASFAIPKPVDLASGTDPRRVLILQGALAGKLSRSSAPRLSPNVFVTADASNTLEAPLLAGPADVYIETVPSGGRGAVSNFVGKEMLRPAAAGEEFPLHLGIDQDLKVTFTLVKKEHLTKEGAPVRKIRFSYLATIESFKKVAVDLKVQDRVPVSAMKEIRVTNVDLAPKPAEEREDGIVTWSLAAVPKQTIKIEVAYTIEFPGEWDESSLNLR